MDSKNPLAKDAFRAQKPFQHLNVHQLDARNQIRAAIHIPQLIRPIIIFTRAMFYKPAPCVAQLVAGDI